MALPIVQFLALVLTALSLVPAGAHFFELPNKMPLDQQQYFTVQHIYNGWALLGIVLIGALVAQLVLMLLLRRQRLAFWCAVVAFLAMGWTLASFFLWTYPANVATHNWTEVPANWQALRRQWEYTHAMGAIATFVSLCAVTLSIITARRSP
jgi:hypothetical protein